MRRILLGTLMSAALAALPLAASGQDTPAGGAHPFSRIFERVGPSVARVLLGRRYASAVLVSDDGLLVTHRDIVRRNVMTVMLPGRPVAQARTLVRDEETELAVLQLLADEGPAAESESSEETAPERTAKAATQALPVAPKGSSESLRTGSWVASVAYPFGADEKYRQQPSLSAGLLSGKGKIPTRLDYAGDLLLTDAAANAGSEGGALVDAEGRVVGILCRPQYNAETGTALNVALPVELLPALLKRARENPDPPIAEEDFARRTHGFLGIFKAPRAARCVVGGLIPGAPAEKAGIKPGDIITRIGEDEINNFEDLTAALQKTKPGDTVHVIVERRGDDGVMHPVEMDIELAKYPEQEE